MITFIIIFIILHIISLTCSSIRFDKSKILTSIAELLIPIVGLVSAVALYFNCVYIAFIGLFLTSVIKIAPVIVRKTVITSKILNNFTKYTLIIDGVIELILLIIIGQIIL